ncbi:MAG: hypothetical protein Kow0090_02950 [Myxococcota bacterium]
MRKRELNILKKISAILWLIIAAIFPLKSAYGEARTLEREFDAVVIEGDNLPPMLGAMPEQIRVYAVKNNTFEPIPFQIDEKNSEGQYSLEHGAMRHKDEDPKFDRNDELVFMALDAGDRAENVKPPEGAKGSIEVKISDPVDGKKAWVYIFGFKNPPEKSKKDYVNFSPKSDCVHTPYYSLCNKPETTWFDNITGKAPSGGNGEDYFDRIKLRSITKLRSLLFGLTFNVTENDFSSKILSFKDGAVRVLKRTQVYFNFVGGIKLKTDISENYHYYGYYMIPKSISSPFDLDSLATSSDLRLMSDFNEKIIGNSYINPNMEKPVLIDGRPSDEKRKIDGGKSAEWNVVFGPKGNLIERTLIDPSANVTWVQVYRDDLETPDPPEDHKGVVAGFGKYFDMTGIKKGHYWFKTVIIFPKQPFDYKQTQFYLNIEDKPLEITVKPYGYEEQKNETRN